MILPTFAEKFPRDEVAVIGVSPDSDFDALRAAINAERLTWPQIWDGQGDKGSLVRLYNITAIPTTYIIDQKGCIAFKKKRKQELEEAVLSLMET